jgi:hypothetical protein
VEGGLGVVKSRATHGEGPMGPQRRHQNRLFSANVVLFRRTQKSARRGREGGQDPVRERARGVFCGQGLGLVANGRVW